MDSPRSDANNQIVISDVSSKSHEEPSVDQGGQSSESAAAAADHHEPPPPDLENYQLVIPEQDREYGCRYCHKKFSNKQALGGHQNAHKVERAMEKNVQENNIGYFGSSSSYHGRMNMAAAAPFLTPYHRPHDFLHRSLYSWSFPPQKTAGGGGVVPYNSRPAAAAGGGFNSGVYSGWSGPRTAPFPARPHYTLPGQSMNIKLANFGAGSSNAFRPGSSDQGRSGFPGLGIRPGGVNNGPGPSVAINLRNVPGAQQGDESDLDLSLKL